MAPGSQDDLLRALAAEPLDARAFAAPDLALLKYADKLTRAPSTIDAGDIARLRAAGFDDRAIHDACAIVAYFAFVNRTADGLGVELEGHVAGESP
jgi:alkylhydroperoxidase family enzyme